MVAAFAKQELGDEIDVEVFRYPDDFNAYLEVNQPRIAAFSCLGWNIGLACQFARLIKERWPDTITVFGNVNFPTDPEEQHDFLAARPAIDFYIQNEGERPFVALYEALRDVDFDAARLKAARTLVPSTRYLADDELVAGEMMERIVDLDTIPSVFLSGFSDKFFDGVLVPMMETSRGCPYSCTFCVSSDRYHSKVRRFSQERINAELDYIIQRTTVNEFFITDDNFGIFKEDIDTARHLASLQAKYGFPKRSYLAAAKNNKANVVKISKIIDGDLYPSAAIQTTDEEVLRIIKRTNPPMEDLDEIENGVEIILNLPGDSKRAHFKSIFDMLDTGSTLIRCYQFTLLEGTPAANKESRKKFALETKFRVTPRCFGSYTIMGEKVDVVETEEICISSSTMTFEDYCDCRALNLTIEIFINDAIFYELLKFLDRYGVSRSEFVKEVHALAVNGDNILAEFYRGLIDDEKEKLWNHPDDVTAFVTQPGVVQGYIDGTYGVHEIRKYRTKVLTQHMDLLHEIAFDVGRQLMGEEIQDKNVDLYMSELKEFSLMRKNNFLNSDKTYTQVFHFDFAKLVASDFMCDPLLVMIPEGVRMKVLHSPEQRQMIKGWISQYAATSESGLQWLLMRAELSAMYRVAGAEG